MYKIGLLELCSQATDPALLAEISKGCVHIGVHWIALLGFKFH